MRNTTDSIKYALAAGVLSAVFAALLWLSLLNVPFLPIIFGMSVSLPIFFALFAYGLRSACLAALTAAILLCLILPIGLAAALSAFFFIPALFTGWLLGLRIAPNRAASAGNGLKAEAAQDSAAEKSVSLFTRQTAPDSGADASSAYPLPAALFQLALAVAFVTIAVLFYAFSMTDSPQFFRQMAEQIISFMRQNNLYQAQLQNTDMEALLRRLLPIIFAVSLALYGFLFQLAALYGAMRLARRRKLLKRPCPYWPAELRMPPMALFLFIGLWIISYFIDGAKSSAGASLALCLNVILTVLALGFCAAGLAALHQAARGGWIWLRALVYIGLFSVILTPLFFFGMVIMGLFTTPFPPRSKGGESSLP